MTKITLGVGADAVDVEDGASVPLIETTVRGHVHIIGSLCCLRWGTKSEVACSFDPENGKLHRKDWGILIDLAALRRERAPKAVTVWRCAMPAPDDSCMELQRVGTRIRSPHAQTWVHRPGAHPETWAAFDAAMDALLRVPSHDPWKVVEVRANLLPHARALGYGKP